MVGYFAGRLLFVYLLCTRVRWGDIWNIDTMEWDRGGQDFDYRRICSLLVVGVEALIEKLGLTWMHNLGTPRLRR